MEWGASAIQPHIDAIPAFTEQDVRDYLSSLNVSGSLMGSRIILHGQPTITQIVFSTIHDLGRATGDGTWEANYPADLPICYVELSENMQFIGPPGHRRSQRASQGEGIGTVFLLFDARTGNHFVTGAPARARWD
jgi:hypothetical protein